MRQLILGPPGTGKTTRLLSIVEQELRSGTPPDRIAFMTFTRAAAQEAAQRAMDQFGLSLDDLPYFRTLHSLAFRQLGLTTSRVIGKRHFKELGDALGLEFRGSGIDPESGESKGTGAGDRLLSHHLYSKATRLPLRVVWEQSMDHVDWFQLKQFVETYQEYKAATGLWDFSDMLDEYREQCVPIDVDVAIIDEAQDLSSQQWSMAEYALGYAKRVYVAGDDDQAIYRWAGADVNKFMAFSTDITVLDHSYRLPGRIWELAGRVSGNIKNRISKTWDSRPEAGRVSKLMRCEHLAGGLLEGEWLFLARHRHQLDPVDKLLRSTGVLFSKSGVNSVSRKHVDAIYGLTALQRGATVNPDIMQRILTEMSAPGARIPAKEFYTLSDLSGALGEQRASMNWFAAFSGIPATRREYYRSCLRNGEKLREVPRIRLSTIHGAKGWEADNVVLFTDINQRAMRGFRRFPDDEHRVFYVGVTRARERLHVVNPATWMSYPIQA